MTMQALTLHTTPLNGSALQAFNLSVDRFESDEHEPALRKWLRATGKL